MNAGFEYFERAPDADLAPFVECIWGVRAGPAVPGSAEHTAAVLPNGATELMVNFGPDQQTVGQGDTTVQRTFRHAWVAGIQDRRLVHASPHGADHISVRFRPGGAHAFFPLPMHDLANDVVELDGIIGPDAASLRDRLGALESAPSRATLLQDWLRQRRRVHHSFPTTRRALRLLTHSGPRRPSVRDTCERLGLSNKHLVHEFGRTVGLAPNVVGRIARLQGVIAACERRAQIEWRMLALEHGYADQPHLIREFRRFGGVTPRQFLRRRSAGDSHFAPD